LYSKQTKQNSLILEPDLMILAQLKLLEVLEEFRGFSSFSFDFLIE